MGVYEGGIPMTAGKVLHPSVDMEGEGSDVKGAEGAIGYTKGGPAVNSGGTNKGDFLSSAGYDAGNMEAGRPSGMKIVNPDDLKSNV